LAAVLAQPRLDAVFLEGKQLAVAGNAFLGELLALLVVVMRAEI
jgi:hypothetical protein